MRRHNLPAFSLQPLTGLQRTSSFFGKSTGYPAGSAPLRTSTAASNSYHSGVCSRQTWNRIWSSDPQTLQRIHIIGLSIDIVMVKIRIHVKIRAGSHQSTELAVILATGFGKALRTSKWYLFYQCTSPSARLRVGQRWYMA